MVQPVDCNSAAAGFAVSLVLLSRLLAWGIVVCRWLPPRLLGCTCCRAIMVLKTMLVCQPMRPSTCGVSLGHRASTPVAEPWLLRYLSKGDFYARSGTVLALLDSDSGLHSRQQRFPALLLLSNCSFGPITHLIVLHIHMCIYICSYIYIYLCVHILLIYKVLIGCLGNATVPRTTSALIQYLEPQCRLPLGS